MSEQLGGYREPSIIMPGETDHVPVGSWEVTYAGGRKQTFYEDGEDGFRVVVEDIVTGATISDDWYPDSEPGPGSEA